MKSNRTENCDPGALYKLYDLLGQGTFGKVHSAIDNKSKDKMVAIKIQKYNSTTKHFIEEEYKMLKLLSDVSHFVDFYCDYKKNGEVWFSMELCAGGTALNLVSNLSRRNRRISEEHMAYILKEIVKAIIYLHEKDIIHRDIKGSNILLTREGEVKLSDFGLAKKLTNKDDVLRECIGSPYWMAPEVVAANISDTDDGFYDNRVDVWSLGITAIELAQAKTPFLNMYPSRALSQIVKNPPPTLEKVSNWTETFHDFISECLIKNFEHRPYIMEIIEHPFLEEVPENNYHLTLEIKKLIEDVNNLQYKKSSPEVTVIEKYLKTPFSIELEEIVDEDLADLDSITEKNVLDVLEKRFKKNEIYSFIGDILVALHSSKKLDIYGEEYHKKYTCKSRSDNAPHIYAIADSAYQNALHHKIPQYIVFTGESGSGKTTNYLHVVDHLFYVGNQHPVNSFRIKNGIKLIHALTHASTPTNTYSTRAVLKTSVSFGQTGKLTGANFKVNCLEKWRVSSVDMIHPNFHILYYVYDGLVSIDALEKYKLNAERGYRYLRILELFEDDSTKPRDNIELNVIKYKKISSYLEEFEFSEEQISTFYSIIAAILNLGEIRFNEGTDDASANIENPVFVENVADLLKINEKKFRWALTNYCVVKKGSVTRKRNTTEEARDIRDVLANNLYTRFVDYVVNVINEKLEIGKAIFGEKYTIKLLDFSGFECFKENHLPQLFVNCLNEQLQFHYLQRVFACELQDLKFEGMEFKPITYFDNKDTLNQLLSKPDGILRIIDDASRRNLDGRYVMDHLHNHSTTRVHVKRNMEFAVAHYTGTVSYCANEMVNKNRDFLPSEIVETLRESENEIIKMLFLRKLDKTGNLILHIDPPKSPRNVLAPRKITRTNQYSQTKNLRTTGSVFRYLSLDLLKELSVGDSSGSTHFVRCIRSDLNRKPEFHRELVRHQIRALSVVETARIRQNGYPQRITFPEFLRRYKFLAFDFDENVEITKENCRLLLIRLKMEDWAIGKSRVFLKYYNEEYLARLYETQVKKIIKIQSILRGYIAKFKIAKQIKEMEKSAMDNKQRRSSSLTEEEAAEIIQKAYRRVVTKKLTGSFQPLKEEEFEFISPYARKWKNRSIFYVLLQYRAIKLRDFYNFSQQVHLYNQNSFYQMRKIKESVNLNFIDRKAQVITWLGELKPVVVRLQFRLDEIPFYDTSMMCDALTIDRTSPDSVGSWDSPYQWRRRQLGSLKDVVPVTEENSQLTSLPYVRDPDEPLAALPATPTDVPKQEGGFGVSKKIFGDSIQGNQGSATRKFCTEPNMYSNSTPANKDFEFIRSSSSNSKPKNVDPISELRSMAQRRDSNNEDDEPPFNFKGMLRKTNFQRDSMKQAYGRRSSMNVTLNAIRRFSIQKDKDSVDEDKESEKPIVINSKPVYMELVPGLVLEGIQVDL